MEEFKGTPGPWHYDGYDNDVGPHDGSLWEWWSVCNDAVEVAQVKNGIEDAHLIAASYDLLLEHHEWAKEIGKVYMAVIQGDMVEARAIIEDMAEISFATGEPVAHSPAIAKALGEDHE